MTETKTWRNVSFALVLPYSKNNLQSYKIATDDELMTQCERVPVPKEEDDKPKWRDKGRGFPEVKNPVYAWTRRFNFGDLEYETCNILETDAEKAFRNHWSGKSNFFISDKIKKAVRADRHVCWRGEEILSHIQSDFNDTSFLRFVGAERLEYDGPVEVGEHVYNAAVFHFAITEASDDELTKALTSIRRDNEFFPWKYVLSAIGIRGNLEKGGWVEPCDDTSVSPLFKSNGIQVLKETLNSVNEKDESPYLSTHTFLISHAIPKTVINRPKKMEHYDEWTPSQCWNFIGANGIHAGGTLKMPGMDKSTARESVFSSDVYEMRISADGLCAIGDDRALRATQNEILEDTYAAVQTHLHSVLLNVVIFALRQRNWLDKYAEELPTVGELLSDDKKHISEKFKKIENHSDDLCKFRNQMWFDDVPGKPQATTILRQMQNSLGRKKHWVRFLMRWTSCRVILGCRMMNGEIM